MKLYQDLAKYAFRGGFKLLIVYLLKMIWQTIRYKLIFNSKLKDAQYVVFNNLFQKSSTKEDIQTNI